MLEALGSLPSVGNILLLNFFLFSRDSVESTECTSILLKGESARPGHND